MNRKVMVTLLLVVLVFGLTCVSVADSSTKYNVYADKLAKIGVFKGTGSGFELERQPTRLEGLVMLIRLLGKEDEALALPDGQASYFSDVPSWAVKYTNYAQKNNLTLGIGGGMFGSTQMISSSAYHTFLLRALGYDDSKGDFKWDNANAFALQKGILKEDYYQDLQLRPFLRDHVAKSSFDTLFSTKKESNVRLIDSLVATGDITSALALSIEERIKIGMVTDTGGIADISFNQSTWEGIVKFATEYNLSTKDYNYLESNSELDFTSHLSTLASEACDLIIAPGFQLTTAVEGVAKQFPNRKFLLLDSEVILPNVQSALFAEEEGSYLAGLAAALKAQAEGVNKVGFIGGIDFELIQKFEAGFEAGVYEIDPKMEVIIKYANSFNDAEIGQTLAAELYDAGANVIYHAAGGVGYGVISEAKERAKSGESVWVIGVDRDQYQDGIYAAGKSVILTSMLKRLDIAAYKTAQDVLNNQFTSGTVRYDLSNGGVSLPIVNPNLTAEWLLKINRSIENIKSKAFVVPRVPVRLK